MFLKWFMLLLKPSDATLESSSEHTTSMQYRLNCYQYLLERLLKRYSQYAISDTVIASYGHFKIVHELRDFEFESEVRRNGMVVSLPSTSGRLPVKRRKAQSRKYWSYFDFKDTLHVVTPQGDVLVEHSSVFSVIGSAEATIEGPEKDDIVLINRINMQAREAAMDMQQIDAMQRPAPAQIANPAPEAEPKPTPAIEERSSDKVWYTTTK